MNLRRKLMSHERPTGTSENEWDTINPDNLTLSQRIAKATKGIVTLPNVVSAAGAWITAIGLLQYTRGNYAAGTGMVVGGRAADLVDGSLAEALHVRGKAGAFLDATVDKTVGVLALGTLTYTGDLPVAMAAGIAITQAGIVAENARIQNCGGKATPNLTGKLATFVLWTAGAAYMSGSAFESAGYDTAGSALHTLGHATAAGAIALGASAWREYRETASALKQSPDATV